MACIVLGLAITAPFSIFHPATSFEKNLSSREWLGEIKNEDLATWIDGMLLLVFGGIPWQVTDREYVSDYVDSKRSQIYALFRDIFNEY